MSVGLYSHAMAINQLHQVASGGGGGGLWPFASVRRMNEINFFIRNFPNSETERMMKKSSS